MPKQVELSIKTEKGLIPYQISQQNSYSEFVYDSLFDIN